MMTQGVGKILFVCCDNSAYSQIAEGYMQSIGGDQYWAASAGLEPKPLNPMAIHVMREIGIDISNHTSKSIGHFLQEPFDYVILMFNSKDHQEPAVQYRKKKIDWTNLKRPVMIYGFPTHNLWEFRKLRDDIVIRIQNFAQDELKIAISGLE